MYLTIQIFFEPMVDMNKVVYILSKMSKVSYTHTLGLINVIDGIL